MPGFMYCKGPGPQGRGCGDTIIWCPAGVAPHCPACTKRLATPPEHDEPEPVSPRAS